MTLAGQDIGTDPASPYIAGDALSVAVTTTGFNLNDAVVVVWALVENKGGEPIPARIVLEKTLENGITTQGQKITVQIDSGDTDGLAGLYFQELRVILTDNGRFTGFVGDFKITRSRIG